MGGEGRWAVSSGALPKVRSCTYRCVGRGRSFAFAMLVLGMETGWRVFQDQGKGMRGLGVADWRCSVAPQ